MSKLLSMRQWYEGMKSGGGLTQLEDRLSAVKKQMNAAGRGARAGGESLITGAALGALHAKLPGGLDFRKVPIDAVVGGLGMVTSVICAEEEFSKDAGNVAAACLAIYSFRKCNDLVLNHAAGRTPGGGSAPVPGTIAKFGGEDFGTERRSPWGAFLSPNSHSQMAGESSLTRAARNL